MVRPGDRRSCGSEVCSEWAGQVETGQRTSPYTSTASLVITRSWSTTSWLLQSLEEVGPPREHSIGTVFERRSKNMSPCKSAVSILTGITPSCSGLTWYSVSGRDVTEDVARMSASIFA